MIEALGIPGPKIRELDLLGRDEIVRVVEESCVRGPLWLVRDIVDQAEGQPGLAVTLSQLCLQGGVREVALGEHLLRHTVGAFERLVGTGTTEVLAAFALGGRRHAAELGRGRARDTSVRTAFRGYAVSGRWRCGQSPYCSVGIHQARDG